MDILVKPKKSQGGKRGRKVGRNAKSPAHKRYLTEKRWIRNKARKIKKYMKSHPNWMAFNISDDVQKLLK